MRIKQNGGCALTCSGISTRHVIVSWHIHQMHIRYNHISSLLFLVDWHLKRPPLRCTHAQWLVFVCNSVCVCLFVSMWLCVCVLQVCARGISYLHSHALCSVKLMKISFCPLWGFILLICKRKREREIDRERERERHLSDLNENMGCNQLLVFFSVAIVAFKKITQTDNQHAWHIHKFHLNQAFHTISYCLRFDWYSFHWRHLFSSCATSWTVKSAPYAVYLNVGGCSLKAEGVNLLPLFKIEIRNKTCATFGRKLALRGNNATMWFGGRTDSTRGLNIRKRGK